MDKKLKIIRKKLFRNAYIVNQIIKIAKEYEWNLVQVDTNTLMLGFTKGENRLPRINFYTTKCTFVTQLEHPKQGKTQLFRRWVDEPDFHKIFENPRTHTGHGYHKREDRQ